jgi:hypothetical protein
MIFKFEFGICFETNDQGLFGPTGQLAQPAHSGAAKLTRLGSGSVTRPSPAPLALLSLPSITLATRIAVASLLRPTPVTTAAATLGEMLSSAPSTSSTKQNRRPPPLRGDRVDLPSRDLPPPGTPDAVPRRWSLLSMSSVLRCLRLASACRWKRQGVVLPVQLDEDLPRPRLVGCTGTTSPCRPGMHLGDW